MLLTAYRAAGLRVNVLMGIIEMEIQEMAFRIYNLKINVKYIILRSSLIIRDISWKRRISCAVDPSLKERSAHKQCGTACLCTVMQPSQHTAGTEII